MENNKIKLNDVEYITKESYANLEKELLEIKEKLTNLNQRTKSAKRFPLEQELKLLKLLNKIFNDYNDSEEDYLIENDKMIVDPANVCGVIGKTEQAKRILSRFIDQENKKEIPNLDFKTLENEVSSSKVSLDFMNKILAIIGVDSDAVRITTRKDFPVRIENQHFIFVLAPRVNTDDEGDNYQNEN